MVYNKYIETKIGKSEYKKKENNTIDNICTYINNIFMYIQIIKDIKNDS